MKKALALAVGLAALILTAGQPASADPYIPQAKPDIRVSCTVSDDTMNYGDGIDWWVLKVTHYNAGFASVKQNFTMRVTNVWTPQGPVTPTVIFYVGYLAPGESRYDVYWITKTIKDYHGATASADIGNVVAEFYETNNFCNA